MKWLINFSQPLDPTILKPNGTILYVGISYGIVKKFKIKSIHYTESVRLVTVMDLTAIGAETICLVVVHSMVLKQLLGVGMTFALVASNENQINQKRTKQE